MPAWPTHRVLSARLMTAHGLGRPNLASITRIDIPSQFYLEKGVRSWMVHGIAGPSRRHDSRIIGVSSNTSAVFDRCMHVACGACSVPAASSSR